MLFFMKCPFPVFCGLPFALGQERDAVLSLFLRRGLGETGESGRFSRNTTRPMPPSVGKTRTFLYCRASLFHMDEFLYG